ncbi:MAG: 2-isopropylmalate synthase [Christensenellaceae bacterium]|nr:2-isopropylmalate synthase [Christensenellaceae bacterium]
MADRVRIFDTTLRDGEQTPGISFHLREKLEIARALERMGVDVIEAGFAASSKGDMRAIQAISAEVKDSVICSLCRCVEADIRAASEALEKAAQKRIHVFIATSPIHMAAKLHMTPDEVYDAAVRSVTLARNLCDDVEFSLEDATRTEPEFLYRMVEAAIRAGASTINLPDTVGYAAVSEYGQMFRDVLAKVPGADKIILSAHCHNDLGLSVATSLEAIRAGARQVECTVNGLGERAGNAPMEEIIMGLRTRKNYYSCDTRADTRRIYQLSRMLSSLTGVEPSPNKPVVGANAFQHQSGVHQHGVLSNRETYEIMKPEELGIPQQSLALGKLSGKHALADRASQLGYRLEGEELNSAFASFKDLTDRKREITDRDVLAILRDARASLNGAYKLFAFQIFTGNRMTSTATVTLEKQGETVTRAATGDGPVEAIFNAVDDIAGMTCTLMSYNIKAVTEGRDALGEVTVRVNHEEDTVLGRGVSTDILEASCLAYVNAVNRLIRHREAEKQTEEAT